ncbi:hypothetical protein ACFPIK_17810 [Algoriphagus aquatilis]|uniref:Uncharacterized protein n=1 Tax=Algoriphagus aquatilis TaxID=490186 RepID=A0ABW0C2Y7_9BACT
MNPAEEAVNYLNSVGYDQAFKELKNEWKVKKTAKPSSLDYIVDDWIKELHGYLKQINGGNDLMKLVGQVKFPSKYMTIKLHAILDDLTFDAVLDEDPDPIKRLLTHDHKLIGCDYWKWIGELYMTTSNNNAVLQILKLIFSAEEKDKKCLMIEEEIQFLDSLPEEIEIHRGMTVKESKNKNYGMSWSLNKKIAEFFAYEYMETIAAGKPMTVVTMKIPKSEVIAYFNRRNEEEILWVSKKK